MYIYHLFFFLIRDPSITKIFWEQSGQFIPPKTSYTSYDKISLSDSSFTSIFTTVANAMTFANLNETSISNLIQRIKAYLVLNISYILVHHNLLELSIGCYHRGIFADTIYHADN